MTRVYTSDDYFRGILYLLKGSIIFLGNSEKCLKYKIELQWIIASAIVRQPLFLFNIAGPIIFNQYTKHVN